MPERTIVYMAVEDLVGATVNPKLHDEAALAESLADHGYTEPLMLDERTGRLVAGHGRAEALRAAAAVDVVPPEGVLVGDGGRWMVPVVRGWSSRDDAHANRYMIASNRLVERGGWDETALKALLEDLAATDTLSGTGFDERDLEALAGLREEPAGTEPGADDEPWAVMVDCETEADQIALLRRLMEEGRTCRALLL